ncbi:MAG: hypothetical protein HY368_02175 [Candidatus Aenigmarchaeota archaeon]|nr:hypothetical protein [Candidatus Aenigmarchaeota archaeon]
MAVPQFIWFVWALSVTLSNIIIGALIFHYLNTRHVSKKDLGTLREISFYYVIGLMIAIISSVFMLFLASS